MTGEAAPPNRIRELRERAELTLGELAKRCDPVTTVGELQKIETASTKLTVEWMRRVAAGLGVRPGALLNPEDSELNAEERAFLADMRALPSVAGKRLIAAMGSIAGIMRDLSAATGQVTMFPGDKGTADRMAYLWASWSEDQRRQALAIMEASNGFGDASRAFVR
jgi:transcriptional regulator with XRE-family HTH domain